MISQAWHRTSSQESFPTIGRNESQNVKLPQPLYGNAEMTIAQWTFKPSLNPYHLVIHLAACLHLWCSWLQTLMPATCLRTRWGFLTRWDSLLGLIRDLRGIAPPHFSRHIVPFKWWISGFFSWRESTRLLFDYPYPYHPCMLHLPTFIIQINQM